MTQNPIVAMFEWWNDAMRDSVRLTPEGFARFYTEDARLIVNGNLRATGHAALATHYAAIADRCDEVAMVLPVEEGFATETRAFVHCRTHVVVEGRAAAEEAMAYAIIEDGRIALLRVVSLSV